MGCRNHPERKEWNGNTRLCEECAAAEGSRLYNEQDGKCAICGEPFGPRDAAGRVPRSAQLDHDHESGQVRGGLCRRCNLGIGYFRDDPNRLRAAAVYLEKWQTMATGQK